VRFGLRLFAVPRVNEMAVGLIVVMRRTLHWVCVCSCGVLQNIYFKCMCSSYECLSCFQKAPNYSFIVLQNFHWNVPFNDGVTGESILCGFVTARQLGYVTALAHTHPTSWNPHLPIGDCMSYFVAARAFGMIHTVRGLHQPQVASWKFGQHFTTAIYIWM